MAARAVHGLLARPLISEEHFSILYGPFSGLIPIQTLNQPLKEVTKPDLPPTAESSERSAREPAGGSEGIAKYGPNTDLLITFFANVRSLAALDWEAATMGRLGVSAYETGSAEARALKIAAAQLRPEVDSALADAEKVAEESLDALIAAAAREGEAPIRSAMLRGLKKRAIATTRMVTLSLVVRDLISSGDFIVLRAPLLKAIEGLGIGPVRPPTDAEAPRRYGIVYSSHARNRMEQRRVSEEEVEAVLTQSHTTYASRDGTTVYIGRPGGRRIKVVVRQDSSPPFVITVGD
jgi:hypothetical protein